MTVDLRRGTSRFVTRRPGVETRHSFSFGPHYDPANVGFGPLVCHDDHLLQPGRGFPAHRHADVEIVTWVVSGSLVHDGSSVLLPGRVAVQSAGAGVTHSEVAGSGGCRFVQAWLRPDSAGGTPTRTVADVAADPGLLTRLVGPGAPSSIRVAGASLAVVRPADGQAVTVPGARLRHIFVVTGSAAVGPAELGEGDAVRLIDEPETVVAATAPAVLLVWAFDHDSPFT